MAVKRKGGLRRESGCQPSANFKVLPAAYLGKGAEILDDDVWIAATKEKRSAKVSKGKADTPVPCQATCDFNERQQGSGLTPSGTAKGQRFMTVCFAQHPRPGGAVEEGEIGMRAGDPIPTKIASGIDNAYLNKLVEGRRTTSVDPSVYRDLGYELVDGHENGRAANRKVQASAQSAIASFTALMTI